ncbi:MAG: hypothetical protein ACR65X_01585 [Methylocystis sp.]
MRQTWLTAFLLLVSGCASPYSAEGIPDLPGVRAEFIADDKAQIIVPPELQFDCGRTRDAVLLKAAVAALESHHEYFEFVDPTGTQYGDLSAIGKPTSPVIVHFCRRTCPGMFSADAIAHVLVRKFESDVRSVWAHGNSDSIGAIACISADRKLR